MQPRAQKSSPATPYPDLERRRSVNRSILAIALLLAAVLAACSGAVAAPGSGGPTSVPGSAGPSAVPGSELVVTAKDLKWVETDVRVPAGQPFELVMDNQDDAPHNVKILDGTGAAVFTGEIATRGRLVNQVPALAAGTYSFLCEVHPDMVGSTRRRERNSVSGVGRPSLAAVRRVPGAPSGAPPMGRTPVEIDRGPLLSAADPVPPENRPYARQVGIRPRFKPGYPRIGHILAIPSTS